MAEHRHEVVVKIRKPDGDVAVLTRGFEKRPQALEEANYERINDSPTRAATHGKVLSVKVKDTTTGRESDLSPGSSR